ncbi:MAG: hypothetical protein VX583_02810 [Bdellovibrionota bacterium]|nr:hypothetical protein [Pseudobdellovibrionaceae bacterium]|tara:strand:- start:60932 stop:61318 length:387 start_codon:yes stop_codon:yes gene_type:complete
MKFYLAILTLALVTNSSFACEELHGIDITTTRMKETAYLKIQPYKVSFDDVLNKFEFQVSPYLRGLDFDKCNDDFGIYEMYTRKDDKKVYMLVHGDKCHDGKTGGILLNPNGTIIGGVSKNIIFCEEE